MGNTTSTKIDTVTTYCFDTRNELVEFLKMHKKEIVGQKIKCIYSAYGYIETLDDWPIILSFSEYMVAVEYMYLSDIVLHILPVDFFHRFKNAPQQTEFFDSDFYLSYEDDVAKNFTSNNTAVENISVKAFSYGHYRDSVSDEFRPEGGDYFSTIKLHLQNGMRLCICGKDSVHDGYMDVWEEEDASLSDERIFVL